jgi:vancomycin permeability regulator SanA
MQRWRTLVKRLAIAGGTAGALVAALAWGARSWVSGSSQGHIVDRGAQVQAGTAIVLGCRVNGEEVSGCLEERLETALGLYTNGRVQRLLLSGDHGRKGYDEVNTMMDWLVAHGVPKAHIFLDHAGFDTHDSMVRAHAVYQVSDALVVSQDFHLPRAVFLAQQAGIAATGVRADPPGGSVCGGSRWREPLACLKACADALLGSSPRFLGPAIPITGDPCASYDRPEDLVGCR